MTNETLQLISWAKENVWDVSKALGRHEDATLTDDCVTRLNAALGLLRQAYSELEKAMIA